MVYASGSLDSARAEPFGCGSIVGIAGAPTGRSAIATADGWTRVFDRVNGAYRQVARLPWTAQDLFLSDDGATLFGTTWLGSRNEGQWLPVRAYALPQGTLIHEWLLSGQHVAFARRAPRIALYACAYDQEQMQFECWVEVSNLDGQLTLPRLTWVDTRSPFPGTSVRLAPDGSRFSWQLSGPPLGVPLPAPITRIVDAGVLGEPFEGAVVGWIGADRLLLNRYRQGLQIGPDYLYADTVVTDLSGATIGGPIVIREEDELRVLDDQNMYGSRANTVYSIVDGRARWTGRAPLTGYGDAAGSVIVYSTTHTVLYEHWR